MIQWGACPPRVAARGAQSHGPYTGLTPVQVLGVSMFKVFGECKTDVSHLLNHWSNDVFVCMNSQTYQYFWGGNL